MEKLKKYFKDKLHVRLGVFSLALGTLLLSGIIYFLPSMNVFVVIKIVRLIIFILFLIAVIRLIGIFVKLSIKKRIMIFVASVLILPLLFFIPIKCTEIIGTPYLLGDVGGTNYSRQCYSVYHRSFWTEVKGKQTEYLFGLTSLAVWFEYTSDGIPVNDGIYPHRRVETRIFRN